MKSKGGGKGKEKGKGKAKAKAKATAPAVIDSDTANIRDIEPGPVGCAVAKFSMPEQQEGRQPLTRASLAAAPPGVQKQMIGERLYPKLVDYGPDRAAKITGMMLEMNNEAIRKC